MKKKLKLFGIIAMVVVMGFAMTSCGIRCPGTGNCQVRDGRLVDACGGSRCFTANEAAQAIVERRNIRCRC